MNRSTLGRLVMVAILAFALLAAAGCDNSETTIVEPGPGLNPSITVAGSVRALTAGMQCRDGSRCFEAATEVPCRDVLWEVVNQTTGISQNPLAGDPGGSVQFSGVPSGEYVVTQTVTHRDGVTRLGIDHNVTVP